MIFVKKKPIEIEPLELSLDGETVAVTAPVLNTTELFANLNEILPALKKSQEINDTESAYKAVMDLLRAVYGNEKTDEIMAFFDGDYEGMLEATFRHLTDVVYPAMKKIAESRKKEYKKGLLRR